MGMGNLVAVLKGKAYCGSTKFELQTRSAYIASQMRMFSKEITDNTMRKNLKLKELNIDVERARRNYEQIMNMRSMAANSATKQFTLEKGENGTAMFGMTGENTEIDDVTLSWGDSLYGTDQPRAGVLDFNNNEDIAKAIEQVKEQLKLAEMKRDMEKFEIESEAAAREAELQEENRCLDAEKTAIDVQLDIVKNQEGAFTQATPEMAKESAPKF